VSHDRALLREVCDEFWLVSGGALKPFDGDLDDYQRWLLEQARAAARAARPQARAAPAAAAAASAPAATATPPRPAVDVAPRTDRKAAAAARQQRADASKPLKKELNLVDNRLGVLFAERDALEAASSVDTLDAEQRAEQGRRLKAIGGQIEALEARWLELSTRLDEIAESTS
jgi:ATP-binding cassette, subfamily F, member 3